MQYISLRRRIKSKYIKKTKKRKSESEKNGKNIFAFGALRSRK